MKPSPNRRCVNWSATPVAPLLHETPWPSGRQVCRTGQIQHIASCTARVTLGRRQMSIPLRGTATAALSRQDSIPCCGLPPHCIAVFSAGPSCSHPHRYTTRPRAPPVIVAHIVTSTVGVGIRYDTHLKPDWFLLTVAVGVPNHGPPRASVRVRSDAVSSQIQ